MEGNKKAEEANMKDTVQANNPEKSGANQEQLNKADSSEFPSMDEKKSNTLKGICERCGNFGHNPEDCSQPLICSRCKRESHVPRVCEEVMP